MSSFVDASQIVNESGITSSYTFAYNASNLDKMAIQAIITGGNGTVSLQASNDGVNYSPITGASQTFTGSTAVMFDITAFSYKWLLIDLVASSGTLDLVVNVFGRKYGAYAN